MYVSLSGEGFKRWWKLGRDGRERADAPETTDAYELRRWPTGVGRPAEDIGSPPKLEEPCWKGFVMMRGREVPGGRDAERRPSVWEARVECSATRDLVVELLIGGTSWHAVDRRILGSVGWWMVEIKRPRQPRQGTGCWLLAAQNQAQLLSSGRLPLRYVIDSANRRCPASAVTRVTRGENATAQTWQVVCASVQFEEWVIYAQMAR